MISLKSILFENVESDISSFRRQLQTKYFQCLEMLHFYYDTSNNSIALTDIYIYDKFKDQGYGTKILKELCEFADNHKLPIYLIPATPSINPRALRRLMAFYRRFGFIENNGNATFDDMSMYRLPKV